MPQAAWVTYYPCDVVFRGSLHLWIVMTRVGGSGKKGKLSVKPQRWREPSDGLSPNLGRYAYLPDLLGLL